MTGSVNAAPGTRSGFTESIATEMAPYGVTANCIMPSAATRLAMIGWRTARNANRLDVDFDPTDPVHVAEMACYLASPEARWVSGQCFQVRGGIVEHVRTFEVDGKKELRRVCIDGPVFDLQETLGW